MINRLQWVDTLRGVAIFGVLIYHVGQRVEGLPEIVKALCEQGEGGVQLFYLVSAFTLFLSMRSRAKKLHELSPIRNFFIRRFFRIAPLFYCMILFYLLKDGLGPSLWVDDGRSITVFNWIAHQLFLNGWNPYWINTLVQGGWSIAIEMPFYLLVPFLYARVKNIRQAVFLTAAWFLFSKALSLLMRTYSWIPEDYLWKDFRYYWLPNQLPVFFTGVIFYFIYESVPTDGTARSLWRPIFVRFLKVMAPLLLIALALTSFSWLTGKQAGGLLVYRSVGFAALALTLDLRPFAFLVNRFWRFLGKISYSSYLIHFQILPLAGWALTRLQGHYQLQPPPLVQFALYAGLTLAGTMAVAALSYRYIEETGIKYGNRLIMKLESQAKFAHPGSAE